MRSMSRWVRALALAVGAVMAGACSLEGLTFDLEEGGGGQAPECEPGSVVACYSGPAGTEGLGICKAGAQFCNADGVPEGPCVGEQGPLAETCDATEQDEDCDGDVNEEGTDCVCGDGYVSVGKGEMCDDGNLDPTDLCTDSCHPSTCGDGFLQSDAGETCDDGGTSDGDRCSASCQREEVLLTAVGDWHTCALLSDGSVKCWGRNDYGQLGLGEGSSARGDSPGEMGGNLPAVNLGSGKTATALAAGLYHTCALLNDGSVKCWGLNAYGQLGLGEGSSLRGDDPADMGDNLPAVDLGSGKTATALATGAVHTCALLNDGSVKCWGYNEYGQLGLGEGSSLRGDDPADMGDNLPAVNLGSGKTATALAAGGWHTCALLNDGSVKCWGRNDYGQLGLGEVSSERGDDPADMGDNLPAVNLGFGKTATALAAGLYHTCALLSGGSVKCWGRNDSGQLGLGEGSSLRGDDPADMGDNLPAINLGSGKTVTALSVGGYHTCALLNDGSVKCWGSNTNGRLGLGEVSSLRGDDPADMGDNLPAVNLGSGKTASGLAAGGPHTCALLNDGSVKCWGKNDYGQLGLGDTAQRGGQPSDMGDNLPTVKLFSDLW